MMPKPPTWISARITPSPKPLQYVPVSTTARPVTHTAEVDVNSAVISPVAVPSSAATGSASSPVPRAITAAKASTTVRAGCAVNSERRTRAERPATGCLPLYVQSVKDWCGLRTEPVKPRAAVTLPGRGSQGPSGRDAACARHPAQGVRC